MRNILITGIGGDIGQGIAAILRDVYPAWRLVGADVHQRHAGGLYADVLCLAPRADHPDYEPWLRQTLSERRIDACIPTSEAELIFLAARHPVAVDGVPLVTAGAPAIRIGSDKLETARLLASIGVAGPWTIPAESFDLTTPLPCIFKARRSAGSKAVFLCESARDVEFYLARYPSAILQELLLPADREVTCAVFRGRDRRIAVLSMLRTLVGGFTSWAQVIEDEAVTAQCTRVAETLELVGAINVQLRLTGDGPRIFEINPRFSSTVLMRHRLGFRDLVWSLQDIFGERPSLQQPPAGVIGVRVQGAAMLNQTREERAHGR